MKTLVIYHSMDLDGLCSGAIAKLAYPEAELIGYDYNQPFNWDLIPLDDCQVFMLDVSMGMENMKRMRDLTFGRFTWIDHHISSINDYNAESASDGQAVCKAVLKSGVAACELAWEYFFPKVEMPASVRLLGEYDTWRNADMDHWLNEVLPFQFGCRSEYTSPEVIVGDIGRFVHPQIVGIMIATGTIILDYQKEVNKKVASSAFECILEDLLVVCLNSGNFSSQAFESVYDPSRHEAMVNFIFDGKGWRVSVYSINPDIDCSAIAKKRGGGGHKGAAGFYIPGQTIPFYGKPIPKTQQ